MDEPPKFKPPVALEYSGGYIAETETVITGVKISIGNLIGLWIKIWVAGIIAGLLIFGPFILIIYLYESGSAELDKQREIQSLQDSNSH
jgi:hypothetical protein